MERSKQTYLVVMETRVPAFESERRFAMAEQDYAERELARLEGASGGVGLVKTLLGEPKEEDWRHYMRALEHYLDKLDDHQEEIADGLMPVKFFVVNNGNQGEKAVRVRVMVEEGTIHPAKQPPERPKRLDHGPEHKPDWKPVQAKVRTIVSGFERREVRIGRKNIEVEFSELDAHDSADVVNQVLYIAFSDKTKLHYEISSRRMTEPERGEVGV